MAGKQIKLKPVQALNKDSFAALMRGFGAVAREEAGEEVHEYAIDENIIYVETDTRAESDIPKTIPLSNSMGIENDTLSNSISVEIPGTPPEGVSNSISVEIPGTPPERVSNSIPLSNSMGIENDTPIEFDTLRDNYCIRALKALKTQNKSLAALGMLFLLHSLLPPTGGRLKIDHIAAATGMGRCNILAQLEALEQTGLITTVARDVSGRLIHFPKGIPIEFDTPPKLGVSSCSCSSFKNNNNYNFETLSDVPIENDTVPKTIPETGKTTPDGGEAAVSEKGPPEDNIYQSALPSWEKARLNAQAEELFYLGMTAKIEVETLSMQTLKLYRQISQERGRDYAAALFLSLLPRAKDNPAGYIASACKQGAEPSAALITKIKNMWEALSCLTTIANLHEIRKRIQSALEKNDTDTLVSLTQVQARVKVALQLLLWSGTVEALMEKRDAFVASLFGLREHSSRSG